MNKQTDHIDHQLNIGTPNNLTSFGIHYFPPMEDEDEFYNVWFSTSDPDYTNPQTFHTSDFSFSLEQAVNKIHVLISTGVFGRYYKDLTICVHNDDWVCVDTFFEDVYKMDVEAIELLCRKLAYGKEKTH